MFRTTLIIHVFIWLVTVLQQALSVFVCSSRIFTSQADADQACQSSCAKYAANNNLPNFGFVPGGAYVCFTDNRCTNNNCECWCQETPRTADTRRRSGCMGRRRGGSPGGKGMGRSRTQDFVSAPLLLRDSPVGLQLAEGEAAEDNVLPTPSDASDENEQQDTDDSSDDDVTAATTMSALSTNAQLTTASPIVLTRGDGDLPQLIASSSKAPPDDNRAKPMIFEEREKVGQRQESLSLNISDAALNNTVIMDEKAQIAYTQVPLTRVQLQPRPMTTVRSARSSSTTSTTTTTSSTTTSATTTTLKPSSNRTSLSNKPAKKKKPPVNQDQRTIQQLSPINSFMRQYYQQMLSGGGDGKPPSAASQQPQQTRKLETALQKQIVPTDLQLMALARRQQEMFAAMQTSNKQSASRRNKASAYKSNNYISGFWVPASS